MAVKVSILFAPVLTRTARRTRNVPFLVQCLARRSVQPPILLCRRQLWHLLAIGRSGESELARYRCVSREPERSQLGPLIPFVDRLTWRVLRASCLRLRDHLGATDW